MDITLVNLTTNDLDLIYSLYNDQETASLANIYTFTNKAQAYDFIYNLLMTKNVYSYAILYDGQKVGSVTISRIPSKATLEIGYALLKEYRGRGIMTRVLEMITTSIKQSYEFQDIKYLIAKYFERNIKSARLLYKSGFSYVSRELGYNISHKLEVTVIVSKKIK